MNIIIPYKEVFGLRKSIDDLKNCQEGKTLASTDLNGQRMPGVQIVSCVDEYLNPQYNA
ncbi:MAG: hypothetical protein RR980_03105 [Mucinivorans sp.]